MTGEATNSYRAGANPRQIDTASGDFEPSAKQYDSHAATATNAAGGTYLSAHNPQTPSNAQIRVLEQEEIIGGGDAVVNGSTDKYYQSTYGQSERGSGVPSATVQR